MLQQRQSLYRFLLYSGDLCLVALFWILSYWLRFLVFASPQGIPSFDIYLKSTLLHVVVFAFVFPLMKLYQRPWCASLANFALVGKACLLGVLLAICIGYFYKIHDFSRAVYIIYFVFLCAGISLYRPLFFKIWAYLSASPIGDRTLIVGAGPMAQHFYDHIKRHPELGVNVAGYLSEDEDTLIGPARLGSFGSLLQVIKEKKISSVLLILPVERYDELQKLVKSMGNEIIDIKILPDFTSLSPLRGQIALLDDFPLISLHGNALEGWPRVGKRLMDCAGAIIALLLFAPIMVLVALWVKRHSPGPIFYRQMRMGLDGRLFYMYKFRTMGLNAEEQSGPIWAEDEDPRCIPGGNWLRRHNLDELPQLYNVLRGEMSLVGPRPERPEFIEEFKHSIPCYMLRHRVKAGITGWAQINGWRGFTSLTKRIEYDLYYIEHRSLKLDFCIILQTLAQTVLPRVGKE